MTEVPVSPAVLAAARSLALDASVPSIVEALDAAEIPSILLKGRSILERLYDSHELRPYVDIDLLVPASLHRRAVSALVDIGFIEISADRAVLRATDLRRPADGVSVDLHFTLWGPLVPPATVFEVLWPETEPIVIAGAALRRLNDAALALELCLHAVHSESHEMKPLDDLQRGIERLPEDAWLNAAALAARLDSTRAMAAGLRRSPAGAALATRLSLPDVDADAANRVVYLRLARRQHGVARLRRLVLPPPSALRNSSALARRGRVGLVGAYVARPVVLTARALQSLHRQR